MGHHFRPRGGSLHWGIFITVAEESKVGQLLSTDEKILCDSHIYTGTQEEKGLAEK